MGFLSFFFLPPSPPRSRCPGGTTKKSTRSSMWSTRVVLSFLGVSFYVALLMVGQSMWRQSMQQTGVPKTGRSNLPAKIDCKTNYYNRSGVGNVTNLSTKSIDFIPIRDVDIQDIFAASWWQSIPRFLQLNLEDIRTVEDDAFAPILHVAGGLNDARMAVDWLDCSVEHLSKWWKLFGAEGYPYAIGKLQSYVQRAMTLSDSNLMKSTLAIVPFGVTTKNPLEQKVWHASLAAAIASLVRQGVGRVLVVGYYDADVKLALETFEVLLRYQEDTDIDLELTHNKSFSATVGSTELGFVRTYDVKSKFVEVNVPRGALKGLKQALQSKGDVVQAEWLGPSPERFKYIFLTESDQILHARLSEYLIQTMNDGHIIVPHRLQPIPHPLDLKGIVSEFRLLPPEGFSLVRELGEMDSCCDTTDKTGVQGYESCNDFWYSCGFKDGNHSRVSSYELMRLTSGTGVVSLASTEHGRKCIPTKKSQGGCFKKPSLG